MGDCPECSGDCADDSCSWDAAAAPHVVVAHWVFISLNFLITYFEFPNDRMRFSSVCREWTLNFVKNPSVPSEKTPGDVLLFQIWFCPTSAYPPPWNPAAIRPPLHRPLHPLINRRENCSWTMFKILRKDIGTEWKCPDKWRKNASPILLSTASQRSLIHHAE
jgi:hypothetical protein